MRQIRCNNSSKINKISAYRARLGSIWKNSVPVIPNITYNTPNNTMMPIMPEILGQKSEHTPVGNTILKNEILYTIPHHNILVRAVINQRVDTPIVIIFPPHVMYGGTMKNPVIRMMYQICAKVGCAVIRFNFPPMHQKTHFYNTTEEDLICSGIVWDWAKLHCGNTRQVWGMGYGYGGWVSTQMIVRRPDARRAVICNPLPNQHDFSFVTPCPVPCLIVSSTEDEFTDERSINNLYNKFLERTKHQIIHQSVPGGHTYNAEQLLVLQNVIQTYIELHLHDTSNKSPLKTRMSKIKDATKRKDTITPNTNPQ